MSWVWERPRRCGNSSPTSGLRASPLCAEGAPASPPSWSWKRRCKVERATVERQRQAYATAALAAFRAHYEGLLAQLAALQAEGRALSRASPRKYPWRCRRSSRSRVPLPQPSIQKRRRWASRLTAWMRPSACAAASGRPENSTHGIARCASSENGMQPTMTVGLFTVVKPFDYFGATFTACIVDRSLLPDGALSRFPIGRCYCGCWPTPRRAVGGGVMAKARRPSRGCTQRSRCQSKPTIFLDSQPDAAAPFATRVAGAPRGDGPRRSQEAAEDRRARDDEQRHALAACRSDRADFAEHRERTNGRRGICGDFFPAIRTPSRGRVGITTRCSA